MTFNHRSDNTAPSHQRSYLPFRVDDRREMDHRMPDRRTRPIAAGSKSVPRPWAAARLSAPRAALGAAHNSLGTHTHTVAPAPRRITHLYLPHRSAPAEHRWAYMHGPLSTKCTAMAMPLHAMVMQPAVMRPAGHEAAASPSLPSHPASRHSAGFGSHLWTMASRHSVRQGNACVVCTAVHLAPQAPRRKFWPLLAEGGVILTRILQLRSR